jgi:transcriptional regulator with XRE-family HTH domain
VITTETVFNNIRAECARKRWSIEELANALGIERKTFYNWEKKQDFPASVLVQMAELFNITTDELLGLDK